MVRTLGKEAGKDAQPDGGDMLDEDANDEAERYRIRLSKWRQGAFNAVMSPIFFYLVGMCQIIRSPLRHFMLFVQKRAKEGQCLFHLVTGKIEEICEEFRQVFDHLPHLMNEAMRLSGCDTELTGRDQKMLRLLTRKLLTQHWGGFMRRIAKPLSQRLAEIALLLYHLQDPVLVALSYVR